MDLDLAHVRSFLAVVDYGGYHRAAEALHLSQPAVSQHVRRLEAQLGPAGGPLFARQGRGVVPTGRGLAVADELRAVVRAHDVAVRRLTDGDADRRPFVVGVVEHVVDPWLPAIVADLRRTLGRDVQLRVDRSFRLKRRLDEGAIDAAILLDPSGAPRPLAVATVDLRWYAAASVRPGASPAEDPPSGRPLELVAYDAPCLIRELAIEQVTALGCEPRITAESPIMSGVHTAVRAGLGVALLAAGGDGLRPIERGPLAVPIATELWLVGDADGVVRSAVRRALRDEVAAVRRRGAARAA
ncbi:LysR family transcriptional regulator [Patulibacter defluvii]|uniref:LysR family transcriptional regulator n=1 Tax=Patulibacter defluvii TaxID=3095358 RepID=UPI002A74F5EC|nr:LysR family transcriptional regulator [Patulibacter sp. DM4]